MKVAICLHIFYSDYIDTCLRALKKFDHKFDLYISCCDDAIKTTCEESFTNIPNLKNLRVHKVPNRGRNFAPLIIEFGAQLQKYDVFLHLHSKKSLYTGKEARTWSQYLFEYLLANKSVVNKVLDIFKNKPEVGVYYPTTFPGLPHWANHWLLNRQKGHEFLRDNFNIACNDDFIPYPVGGMFWARPRALGKFLELNLSYTDFEQEPIGNDGAFPHTLERVISIVAKSNKYDTIFFDPLEEVLTKSTDFIFRPIRDHAEYNLINAAHKKHSVSFDIFDTVVRRKHFWPDYAKYIFGSELSAFPDAQTFVAARNHAELDLRRRSNFNGDVDIFEIYEHLFRLHSLEGTPSKWAEREFEIDLSLILPKTEIIKTAEYLHNEGKAISLVSDTYYTKDQIKIILQKVRFPVPASLFISSDLRLRKDNATLWHWLKKNHIAQPQKHLHIGDNVVSDIKLPSDLGISCYHILNPIDKLTALNLHGIKSIFESAPPRHAPSYGPLISELGSNPFLAFKGI